MEVMDAVVKADVVAAAGANPDTALTEASIKIKARSRFISIL
jgi:hypothetical protein